MSLSNTYTPSNTTKYATACPGGGATSYGTSNKEICILESDTIIVPPSNLTCTINEAYFGYGGKRVDVTSAIKAYNTLTFSSQPASLVGFKALGMSSITDPNPGATKSLKIKYSCVEKKTTYANCTCTCSTGQTCNCTC